MINLSKSYPCIILLIIILSFSGCCLGFGKPKIQKPKERRIQTEVIVKSKPDATAKLFKKYLNKSYVLTEESKTPAVFKIDFLQREKDGWWPIPVIEIVAEGYEPVEREIDLSKKKSLIEVELTKTEEQKEKEKQFEEVRKKYEAEKEKLANKYGSDFTIHLDRFAKNLSETGIDSSISEKDTKESIFLRFEIKEFKGKKFLSFKADLTKNFDDQIMNRARRVNFVWKEILFPLTVEFINNHLDTFQFINGLSLEASYKYHTIKYEKKEGEEEKVEFFLEKEIIKKLYNFDITSQVCIENSIVLVNGERYRLVIE